MEEIVILIPSISNIIYCYIHNRIKLGAIIHHILIFVTSFWPKLKKDLLRSCYKNARNHLPNNLPPTWGVVLGAFQAGNFARMLY